MTVKIIRRSYYYASLTKIKLRLNGKTALKIKNGETKTVELDHNDSVLQVKNFGSMSNKLVINEGDCVEIDVNFWPFLYSIFIGGASGAANILSPFTIWTTLVLLGLITVIPFFLFPVYTLSKA